MKAPLSTAYHTGLLVFLVLSATVLALLVWAAATRGRQKEDREEVLFRLGYALASPPPPQLIAQITKLHRCNIDCAQKDRRLLSLGSA